MKLTNLFLPFLCFLKRSWKDYNVCFDSSHTHVVSLCTHTFEVEPISFFVFVFQGSYFIAFDVSHTKILERLFNNSSNNLCVSLKQTESDFVINLF
jgi:hypothetical protein